MEATQVVEPTLKEVRQAVRERGFVKWFRNSFGFLTRSDGTDIFAHEKDIDMKGFRTLQDGQEVAFEVEDTAKGPKAVKIKPLD